MSRIDDISADVASLLEAARVSGAAVREAFGQGSQDLRTIRNLRASVQGHVDAYRAIRQDLDLLDVESEQTTDRADDTLTFWTWERGVRHRLSGVGYQLRRLQEALESLEKGAARTMYVVRSGDTLQSIAARMLGSWKEWTRLLDANPSLSPGVLASGTLLTVPDKR
jgi:nucleoid-associated protein YgaU